MTTAPPAPLPRRRKEDHGPMGHIRAWWHRWGQLATGIWLLCVSVAVLAIAIAFLREQSQTETAARQACERARVFGPALARAYDRYRILTPAELAQYRATIPEVCP